MTKPRASVWLARGLKQEPFERATATLEQIGAPSEAATSSGVLSLYVVHLRVPAAGTYWVLAKPEGSPIAGLGKIVVRKHTVSVPVGAAAPPSRTPTLTTTGGRLGPLTTATHPDRALYATSVAQALAAKRPFVVAFATPKFCSSRTCGPVVDVLSYVRKASPGGVTFIHAEVFRGNNPANGYNPWLGEWKLQSEPWIFLVGRDGRIKAKFEGSVSAGELRAAVRTSLE